jgi:hypothetical protein
MQDKPPKSAKKKKPARKKVGRPRIHPIEKPSPLVQECEVTILPPEEKTQLDSLGRKRSDKQNAGGQTGMLREKTKKALALAINHGVDPKTAMTLARGGNPPSPAALTNFRRKVAKHSLSAPSMVKLAHNVVKDVLKGATREYQAQKCVAGVGVVDYTEVMAPTHTNQLAAAAMVMDRVEPIIRHQVNANLNMDFLPVDLDKYK